MNGLGFGHPLDFEPMLKTPGFIEMAWAAPIYLMAEGSASRSRDPRLIGPAFDRPRHRGGIRDHQGGNVRCGGDPGGGRGQRPRAIVIEHIIRMARDVAPDWLASEFDATYRVDIEGEPDIHCAMNLGDAEGHGAGRAAMAATAMRVVNAIPYVIDAPAGLLSSLDLPNTLPRHAFD